MSPAKFHARFLHPRPVLRAPLSVLRLRHPGRQRLSRRLCGGAAREIGRTLEEHARCDSARPITSIFFGGGTPTELPAAVLGALLGQIRDGTSLAADVEITIEANPENLDEEKLSALREAGFNRLSLGAQSFDAAALKTLGRVHLPDEIDAVVLNARRAGWDNIGLDLIYAVPGSSRDVWRETLRRAAQGEVEHVSCYSLTIEPHTAFARRVEAGKIVPQTDDEQAELMNDADELLGAAGIRRYEVSNYARPGRESLHNLNYWLGGDYLACGNGAHGHRAGHRWWNERAAKKYIDAMRQSGTARAGEEFLTAEQRLAEVVVLGLRLPMGFSLDAASALLGKDVRADLRSRPAWPVLTGEGLLREAKGNLILAPQALSLADAVTARLLA